MVNAIVFGYYYKYKQHRQLIKNLVQNDNIQQATDQLNQIITEHDNYLNSNSIINDGNTFTSVDNLSLKHAKDHIQAHAATGDIIQKNATIDAL